ncbi:hypothetical protein O1611_g1000 [Lasiodiplodia mahajangana]|uniref:Uncharacterized protein n=1 Tax=Lasiodiplodia mahajangana TaxID=1108764 RepID=A0ACC2JZI1_9PEZI|nr:hypothetical protein O1611_g1000 [Lasiodiplodia mahajangana]
MSSADVFMSSPPRPRSLDPIPISSSSPYLPSLDEIFLKKSPKKSPFRTVNHAAPIPPKARTTFTSAADVLREAPEIDIDTEKITSSPPRRAKTTANSRRQRALAPDDLPNDRNSNLPAAVIDSATPKDKPWQRFKRKPSAERDDRPLSPTRPKALSSRERYNKTKETVSRHFTARDEDSLPKSSTSKGKGKAVREELVNETLADTLPELAVPRRGDWTPPRSTEAIVADSDSDARELFSSVDREKTSKHVFQTLYTQYGRHELDPVPELSPQPQTEVFRKRMRIELISTGQDEREQPREQAVQEPDSKDLERSKEQKRRAEPKTPAPRKKTRTITELATAPFAASVAPGFEFGGPTTKESMLDYFDADGAVKALVEHQSAVMSQRNPKAKEAKPVSKTTRKKKAGTQANPILLSPNSALKQSSNQDFVFGTSSQLVQEESPTTLRDLQVAIRASNSLNSDPFDDDGGQRLWHAGARDEDGELMGMEIIDLQHGPPVVLESTSTTTPSGRSFVDINDILTSPVPVNSAAGPSSESIQADSHFFQSQSTEQGLGAASSEPESSANAPSVQPRPKYELFTDAQLSKQITSYGFKPVKKRAAMIALLDHCWMSKHQGVSTISVQPLSTSACNPPQQESVETASSSKATTKPRARGRPKKDDGTVITASKPTISDKPSPKRPRGGAKNKETTSACIEVPSVSVSSPKRSRGRPRKSSNTSVEIPDSDNGASSPESAPDPVFSSPPPLDLTISDEGDMSLTISPTDQQAELFKHITKAVISAPRSQDPSNPSWHEKMLLYDPIILEELASWLNGGELTRVGYDGEVAPFDVKKWCESKSVICLWRQNLKGKERKRY